VKSIMTNVLKILTNPKIMWIKLKIDQSSN
jgi:hypothetical protein